MPSNMLFKMEKCVNNLICFFNSYPELNKVFNHMEATIFINHLNRIKNDINNKTKSFEEACTELERFISPSHY